MPETDPTEPTSSAEETESSSELSSESAAAEPAAEPGRASHAKEPAAAPHASRLSLALASAALVLSVIAIAGGVLGYFFLLPHKDDSSSSSATSNDQQAKDPKEAKKRICETFKIVDHEVVRNSRLKNPDNGGPIGALSVATAARLAFYSGGAFLRDRVAQEPATPPDLAKSVNAMGSNLEELAIGYLAGGAEFAQDALRQSLDDKIKATIEMCK
ncbi:hypothetical protein [Mycobacterium sp.]|uniref:hypothetical protein n=1 Tax=Mycobacterium sp. TaxID=1785 RepID=UPI003C708739